MPSFSGCALRVIWFGEKPWPQAVNQTAAVLMNPTAKQTRLRPNPKLKMSKRGLIVGKFYPPHRGHNHLIDTARLHVDHLSVIVCRKPNEDPPGDLRAAWLRQIHPDVNVILI